MWSVVIILTIFINNKNHTENFGQTCISKMSQTMKNVEYNTEITNIYFYAVCSHYNTQSTYLQIITTLENGTSSFQRLLKFHGLISGITCSKTPVTKLSTWKIYIVNISNTEWLLSVPKHKNFILLYCLRIHTFIKSNYKTPSKAIFFQALKPCLNAYIVLCTQEQACIFWQEVYRIDYALTLFSFVSYHTVHITVQEHTYKNQQPLT
jgi:hypothetical protein